MKFQFLLLALVINLYAKTTTKYILYTVPLEPPQHVYDIDCDVKECKKGYTRGGDAWNTPPYVACWCSKYKVHKSKVVGVFRDGYLVTDDCESVWQVDSVDVIKVLEQTK